MPPPTSDGRPTSRTTTKRSLRSFVGPAAAVVLAVACGCSAHEPPRAEIEEADVALRRAAESQATRYAPSDMRRARAKLDGAREAYRDGDYEEAEFLAEQAAVDARLAEAKAAAQAAKQLAAEAQREIDALRREAERTGRLAPPQP
jgi:hypothetical protein